MKKLRLFKFVIVSLILNACNFNCTVDDEFTNDFNNCLKLVEKINTPGYETDFKTKVFTYECLYAVTGYEGRVDKYNAAPDFYNYSDTIDYLKNDIKFWKEWYDANKCIMTQHIADSLISRHSIENGIPGLEWPPPVEEAMQVVD